VRCSVHIGIDAQDLSVGPDEIGNPLGILRGRGVARAVGHADAPARVAKKGKVEPELRGEGCVVFHRVEAGTQHSDALVLELLNPVAEPATLRRSTRRVGLRKEPEHYRLATVVRKAHGLSALVRNAEIGRLGPWLEHWHLMAIVLGPGADAAGISSTGFKDRQPYRRTDGKVLVSPERDPDPTLPECATLATRLIVRLMVAKGSRVVPAHGECLLS